MGFFGEKGLFGDRGEILFFIILFLLLFYSDCLFGYGGTPYAVKTTDA